MFTDRGASFRDRIDAVSTYVVVPINALTMTSYPLFQPVMFAASTVVGTVVTRLLLSHMKSRQGL
jgi:hypothetical protein